MPTNPALPHAAAGAGAGAALLIVIIAAVIWTLVLKGFALWYAARGDQKGWFIAMLILNTVGILEIIYLIWFRPRHPSEEPAIAAPEAEVLSENEEHHA